MQPKAAQTNTRLVLLTDDRERQSTLDLHRPQIRGSTPLGGDNSYNYLDMDMDIENDMDIDQEMLLPWTPMKA